MQDQNFTLDQIIKLVNNPITNNKLPPISNSITNSQKHISNNLPIIPAKLKTSSLSYIPPKTLQFKPWSGKVTHMYENGLMGVECIREEINDHEDDQCQNGKSQRSEIEKETKKDRNSHLKVRSSNAVLQQQSCGYFYKFHSGSGVRLIKYLLQQNGFRDTSSFIEASQQSIQGWTICWSTSALKVQLYHSLLPYQKINHFPNSFHITRKDLMIKTISKMQSKHGFAHFNFIPKTYLIPQQLQQLKEQSSKLKLVYIVKPHNRSQGKGITVTDSLSTILGKLQKYSSLIVSHYIENPLLINRLKFDLRIYVALVSINPIRIYVYDEGLARFATEEYDHNIQQPENKRYQHLTNYSVNKKNSEFIQSTTSAQDYFGSKWSLSSLKSFLNFAIGKTQTCQLFDRIDDILVKTLLCAQNIIYSAFVSHVPYINNCFEVFGFDILVDSNLKPWLIEVNLSPSMNTDSPLDLKIKGNMVADLLTMIGIKPIEERFGDGAHVRTETSQFVKSNDQQRTSNIGTGNTTSIQKFLLREIDDERQRAGGWRKIFPHAPTCQRYKAYFQCDRYFNRLLRQHQTHQFYNIQQSQHQNDIRERPLQLQQIQSKTAGQVHRQSIGNSHNYRTNAIQAKPQINYRNIEKKDYYSMKRNQKQRRKSSKISIRINRSTNKVNASGKQKRKNEGGRSNGQMVFV